MKSASTYYRMARKIGKEIAAREQQRADQSAYEAARSNYTKRDREIAQELEAEELLRKFIATEL